MPKKREPLNSAEGWGWLGKLIAAMPPHMRAWAATSICGLIVGYFGVKGEVNATESQENQEAMQRSQSNLVAMVAAALDTALGPALGPALAAVYSNRTSVGKMDAYRVDVTNRLERIEALLNRKD